MYRRNYGGRKGGSRRGKFSANWDNPWLGTGNVTYEKRGRRLPAGRNYVQPVSGIATRMKTSNNPVMSALPGGAVKIEQREILSTIINRPTDFSLEVFDVNPGLSTICNWGSKIAMNFQQYKMGYTLEYTSSCPSETPGQILIATDTNVGNPTVPNDKQQMSNFSNCVSGQVWAPLGTNKVFSGDKFYVRDGPVPEGQTVQVYDFAKILIAIADTPAADSLNVPVLGTVYINYTLYLYLPRLQYSDESVIFSQFPQNVITSGSSVSAGEIVEADFLSPQGALIGYPSGIGDEPEIIGKTPVYIRGGLEVSCQVLPPQPAFEGFTQNVLTIYFPVSGYYEITMGNYSTFGSVEGTGGANPIYSGWADLDDWVAGPALTPFSIVNPVGEGSPGTLMQLSGAAPDNVVYMQQNFIVAVMEQGTYVDSSYNIVGGAYLACQFGTFFSYQPGEPSIAEQVSYNPFIAISPIAPAPASFFSPLVAPGFEEAAVLASKRLRSYPRRRYGTSSRANFHLQMKKRQDAKKKKREEEKDKVSIGEVIPVGEHQFFGEGKEKEKYFVKSAGKTGWFS